MAERAVLILGTNLGDRKRNLSDAVGFIGERIGEVVKCSGVYESEPWGDVAGEDGAAAGPFLNMAVVADTPLEPEQLLTALKGIEARMGREPGKRSESGKERRKYNSRVIDIDIIYYGDRVVNLPGLQVPHPLVAEREFVLRPLTEAVPAITHPVTGLTPAQMLGLLEN